MSIRVSGMQPKWLFARHCRVDVEFSRWTEVGNFYRHCDKDEGQYFPGGIIAILEQRDGVWVRI
jgi:hypothetical protein